MRIQPDTDAASVVLIGSFNPRIFRPDWFKATEIIGQQQAEAAKVEVIHQAISVFSLDWARIAVEPNRFSIETLSSPLIRIKDVVLKTFNEFLSHTPISQPGINRMVHFSVDSLETRDKIGKLLAPHEPWGVWGSKIAGSSTDPRLHGGLRSLLMSQLDRGDGYNGHVNAKVEPSLRPNLLTTGIYMEVNDNYVLGSTDEVIGSEPAMAIVEGQWITSMARSEAIIDQIMSLKDAVR
jgi:hypothetical protein